MDTLTRSLLDLVVQTSTNLPPDVRAAMAAAGAYETPGTQASQALGILARNIDMATDGEGAICQDTGMPTFLVHTPAGVSQAIFPAGLSRRGALSGGRTSRLHISN
jgi:fumarate hydratase class I